MRIFPKFPCFYFTDSRSTNAEEGTYFPCRSFHASYFNRILSRNLSPHFVVMMILSAWKVSGSATALAEHILRIVFKSAQEKVAWISAFWIVAFMKNAQPFRYRALNDYPHSPMGSDDSFFSKQGERLETSVPVGTTGTCPLKAPGFFVSLKRRKKLNGVPEYLFALWETGSFVPHKKYSDTLLASNQ